MLRRTIKTTNLARLIALNPPDPLSREFVLAKDQLAIGADEHNDIVLREKAVSRRHAMLKRKSGNRWEITDLGSTNGTMVNRAKIKTATEIRLGDEIAIGGVSLAMVGPSTVAGSAKPTRRRVASLRTVLEVGLIFFVTGFGVAQYLAFLKYREENRFMLAQAEAIPAEQLAQRARLASQPLAPGPSSAPTPPTISLAKPAAPVVAGPPPNAGPTAPNKGAVSAASSSVSARTLSIPSVARPANPPAVASRNSADAEATVGVTLAQWFHSSDARIGTVAPDFELNDISGNRVSLASLRGKVVLIDTWATWCHVCRSSMPEFESFYRDFRDSPKFVILTVSQDSDPTAVRRFVDANHYDFPVLMDLSGQFGTAYNITAVPSEILIGSNGQILWYCPGGPNWSDSQIRSEFRKLL
jgi:pSer/pThr/pTyr-binding forkhead associated (FHA) protein/peroxiredoxin